MEGSASVVETEVLARESRGEKRMVLEFFTGDICHESMSGQHFRQSKPQRQFGIGR